MPARIEVAEPRAPAPVAYASSDSPNDETRAPRFGAFAVISATVALLDP